MVTKLFDLGFVLVTNLISVIIGMIAFGYVKNKKIRVLILYWTFFIILDKVVLEMIPNNRTINIVYCLICPVQYFIYIYLFENHIKNNKPLFFFQYVGIVLLTIYAFYQIFFNYEENTMSSNVFLILCILSLFTVMLYFKSIVESREIIILSNDPFFWIATGILFFMAANVISTGLFHQSYQKSKELAQELYKLNELMNFLMSVFFSVSFIIASKKVNI